MSGPPFSRFARTDDPPLVSPDVEKRRGAITAALKGDATPEQVNELVRIGGWAKAAARLAAERPAAIAKAVDLAYCHAFGLELRLDDLDRLLHAAGADPDPWLKTALAQVRETRSGIAKWQGQIRPDAGPPFPQIAPPKGSRRRKA